MVPRFGRRQWALLGTCAGDQASDATGNYRAAIYVLWGRFEFAVQVERSERRHLDQVPSQGVWADPGRAPQGCQPGLGSHARAGKGSAQSPSKVEGVLCPAT